MRALRTTLAATALLGLAPALAGAQSPDVLLKNFQPTQPGVEMDTPTDAAEIAACKVEMVKSKQGKTIGFSLKNGQGQLLRRFVDTNGKLTRRAGDPKDRGEITHLDQWSYYKDGFEVYRETDLDEDGKLDECRWLNGGGTRIAVVKDRIVGWKQVSAEEASKVLVQALVSGDLGLLETVLATPADLQSLGVPDVTVQQVAEAKAARRDKLNALRKALGEMGWDKQTAWYRFDGQMPHVIPVDATAGLKSDLALYENAAIFAGPPSGQGNPLAIAYLQVSEMVKVGDVWKFVDLPIAVDPKKPGPLVAQNGIRAGVFRGEGEASSLPAPLEAALKGLADYDKANALDAAADPVAIAKFHRGRIDLLGKAVVAAAGLPEQLTYAKELVNSLAAAYQTGKYPEGGAALEKLAAKGDKLASYADFRKILAEYAMDTEDPNANLQEMQKKFIARLQEFLKKHAQSDEVPEALYNLASGSEFNNAEDEARAYYGQLAKDHANTEAGKKAAGALKRLDLVDKTIDISGPGRDGRKVDAQSYRGKSLLIVFWSSDASLFKSDIPKFEALAQKYAPKGLEIVGVNLDASKAGMDEFLRENPLPWPQIHEEGGMESRLANEYGIISLPTMFLVDPHGKVVNRRLRSPADVERLLEKPLAGRPVGANIGVK
jgi:hypothetical protein